MLVSGGQILAIDRVYTDGTLSGDGVQHPLGVKTEVIATTKLVSGTSAKLQSEIDAVSGNLHDNYYTKTETSGAQQIQEAFDKFKTTQTIVSAGSDIVDVTSAKLDEKTVIYTVKVTPGEVNIAGASGISAKQIDNTWTIGLSADFLSANALDVLSAYYKKSETSAATAINAALAATSSWANETFQPKGDYLTPDDLNDYYTKEQTSGAQQIQDALDLKQNKADMSAYQLSGDYVSATTFAEYKTKVEQDFVNTSAWATSSFQLSGNYVSADTFATYQQKVEQDFVNTSAWANSAFQTKGNYVSADDFNAYKEEVEQAFADTSSWAKDTFQEKGNYVSADDFNTYKEEVEQTFVDTSAWANDTFQTKGDYLSANALDDISGKWEAAYNTVNANSAYWNEVSAFSANSGRFLTPEGVTDPGLAYFLKKDEETSKIAWSGVDLSNLGKMYSISSLSDNLYAGISADPETHEPFYVISAASAASVVLPDISGSGVSAWKDAEQNKYIVSANIVGNHGVSAKYDATNNTWDVGISANNYSFLFGHYSNNEVLTDGTILKLDSNNYHGIEIDEDGFITLPETTNKFTFCINEYIDDNISQDHNYLLNKLVLSALSNDQIVASQNYYPAEVGSSNVTLALTIDAAAAPNREYCIVYKGSDVAVNKLHIEASILEEVTSLDSTAGASQDYTGRNPIRVVDNSKVIELLYDSNVFSLKHDEALQADILTIEGSGGEVVNKETFDKLLNSVNGRIVETIPIGAINQKSVLGADKRWAYVFRPMIQFDMDPTTTARIITGNASANQSTVIVAVYELDEEHNQITLQWWSEPKVLTKAKGEHVLAADQGCTQTRTIYPDRLYYVTVLCYAQQIEILGETNDLTSDIGDWDIAYVADNLNTAESRNPMTYNGNYMVNSPLGVTAGATLKPYVGFKNVINE